MILKSHSAEETRRIGASLARQLRANDVVLLPVSYTHLDVYKRQDFYFDVCTLDYNKMSHAMDALAARMERTNEVHIKGPGTDLRFSIAGMPAIKCDGKLNIPDGEI